MAQAIALVASPQGSPGLLVHYKSGYNPMGREILWPQDWTLHSSIHIRTSICLTVMQSFCCIEYPCISCVLVGLSPCLLFLFVSWMRDFVLFALVAPTSLARVSSLTNSHFISLIGALLP